MCGIAGIYESNGHTSGAQAFVGSMISSLHHRGPDFSQVSVHGPVTLGHTRLSIIDTTEASHQPFFERMEGNALSYNGEIYNFRQLRSDLQNKGLNFKTTGDTEVLFRLLNEFGISSLSRLNGMFAFAWWDVAQQKLYLVRDRIGIKPLYYSFKKGDLYFSSELRALKPVNAFKLDLSQLNRFLSIQCVPGEHTLLEGIKELKPGHYLEYGANGEFSIQSWYKADEIWNQEKNNAITPEDIRSQFFKCVQRRLLSDVPIGAFLSGGVDSSAIVAAMAAQSSGKVKTFTVGFEQKGFDEREFAALVAKKYDTDHHEILLSEIEVRKLVVESVRAMDTPSGDAINTYIVSRTTKQAGLTVALSGLGGDELFSGYPSFRHWNNLSKMKWFKGVPKSLKNAVSTIWKTDSIQQEKLKTIVLGSLTAAELVYRMRQVLTDNLLRELGIEPLDWLGSLGSGLKHDQDILSYTEIMLYCEPLLLKDTDQMSMAHALEVRVPFLDHEFVSLVSQLPPLKRNFAYSEYPKGFFIEALKKEIPEACYARKKSGFVLPMEQWIKKDLRDFYHSGLFSNKMKQLFDRQKLEKLDEQFMNGKNGLGWSRVWLLSVLGHWMEDNGVTI